MSVAPAMSTDPDVPSNSGQSAAALVMAAPPPFVPYPKTARWSGGIHWRVTEKIDGTNAQITIPVDPSEPILAGSRNRRITPEDDNAGFAAWVRIHANVLRLLGPGTHHGEWWGCAIGRGYGLADRRWSLFDTRRWRPTLEAPDSASLATAGLVACVPLLNLTMDPRSVEEACAELFASGSRAAPGWAKPEGVIVEVLGQRFKLTERDNRSKWQAPS